LETSSNISLRLDLGLGSLVVRFNQLGLRHDV
jgi:hypothetical protein